MVGMIAAQFNAERLRSIDERITNRNLVCMVRLQLPGRPAACLPGCLPVCLPASICTTSND
jgi:hypothetical protein